MHLYNKIIYFLGCRASASKKDVEQALIFEINKKKKRNRAFLFSRKEKWGPGDITKRTPLSDFGKKEGNIFLLRISLIKIFQHFVSDLERDISSVVP